MTPLWTTDKIATIFGVTPETVRLWFLRGWLTGKKIGRSWYCTTEAVNALLEVR